jgi:hypothetical protein
MWSDGFGSPLLTFSREGRAERWHFFSRFHPAASGWVERDAFPAWVQSLLLRRSEDPARSARDRRLADVQQKQPALVAARIDRAVLPAAAGQSRNLRDWFWALTGLLLILERILSLRRLPTSQLPPATATKRESQELEVVR